MDEGWVTGVCYSGLQNDPAAARATISARAKAIASPQPHVFRPSASPSGWSIRRTGHDCQGESAASRVGFGGLRAHGGSARGARPRRGHGAVEELLSWAVEQGRIGPVRRLTILHGGIAPGGAIGPSEADAEQEALGLEKVRESTDLRYEDGKEIAIWIEIGIDGTPELRGVPPRIHGCAAPQGKLPPSRPG